MPMSRQYGLWRLMPMSIRTLSMVCGGSMPIPMPSLSMGCGGLIAFDFALYIAEMVAFPVQKVAFTVETRGTKCNGYCNDCV